MARVDLGTFPLEGIGLQVGNVSDGTNDIDLVMKFLTDVLGIDGDEIRDIHMRTWHNPETYDDLVWIRVDMDDHYETVLRMKHPEIFG